MASRFTDHHAFMIGELLTALDQADGSISLIEERIEEAMTPFRAARDALTTLPGYPRRSPT